VDVMESALFVESAFFRLEGIDVVSVKIGIRNQIGAYFAARA